MKAQAHRGLAAALIVAGCASAVPTSPIATTEAPTAAAKESPAAEVRTDDGAFAEALARATADPGKVRLRLDVVGELDGAPAQFSLLGRGIGIWGRSRQIAIPTAVERAILGELVAADFIHFGRVYGGRKRDLRQPPVVSHSIAVELDDDARTVVQLVRGEPFEPLRSLVERLLAIGAVHAANVGEIVEVVDLADGLARVAGGTVAAPLLGVVARVTPKGVPPCPADGFWMRLDRGRVEAALTDCAGALGERYRLEVSDEEVRRLALRLAEHPTLFVRGSLRAAESLELAVEVLDQRHSIVARRTAQQVAEPGAVDAISTELRSLAMRALREGSRVAGP